MSVTLLHHGHIEILRKAHKLGEIFVALTKDNAILKKGIFTRIKLPSKIKNYQIDQICKKCDTFGLGYQR